VDLHPGAMPLTFGDRTAGALDLRRREGDRTQVRARATASFSNAALFVEGPLDKSRRGSWLVAARKSYLQFLIDATADDTAVAFGFDDTQTKINYDLTPGHNVSLSVTDGRSGLDRSNRSLLGLSSLAENDYNLTVVTLASRYTPGPSFLIANRVAYLRERFNNWNRDGAPLAGGCYGEWVWNAEATRVWKDGGALDFGWSVRKVRDSGNFDRLVSPTVRRRLDEFHGDGLRTGGYAQQTWPLAGRRVAATAGVRWDRHSVNQVNAWSPRAALAIQLWRGARLQLAWGQYVQYPEISQALSSFGTPRLLPERATHSQVSIEQRLGERTRIRVEAYNRLDRDLLFRPLAEPRLIAGRGFNPLATAPIVNSQRGYARGAQIFVQRRTANGFNGWISYTYGRTQVRDGVTGSHFAADFDQRHLVNVFGGYRVLPTVNLSVKWSYGSGLPVPGYFATTSTPAGAILGRASNFALSASRNQVRLPYYQRVDVRVNKAFVRGKPQITVFGEVVNVLSRRNARFDELRSFDANGGARLGFEQTLPLLPTAGVAVDF